MISFILLLPSFTHVSRYENIPRHLGAAYVCKCREIIKLYRHNVSGTFATYCQAKLQRHRVPWVEFLELEGFMPGSKATAVQSIPKTKRTKCVVRAVDDTSGTCTIVFGSGMSEHVVYNMNLSDLRHPAVHHD